jgi:hypothetical protein
MQWSQLSLVDYGRCPNVFFCCSLSRGDAPRYVEGGRWPKKGAVCQWAPKTATDGRETSHMRQWRNCHAPFSSPLAKGANTWQTYGRSVGGDD